VRVAERLERFREEGVTASYDSLVAYLPPEERQRAVLAAVAEDDAGAFDPERVRGTFLAALDANGFHPKPFGEFLDRLGRFLTPERPVGLEDLERRGLGAMLDRYVRSDGDGVRIVTYIFLSDPRWKRVPPPGFVEALHGDDPSIVVTGTNIVGQEFRAIFMREAPRAVLLGLVVVFVLLWVDFRSLRLTTIALAQLICGVVMMFGLMKIAGIHLNYVNAFVATMILGVGIDYGIHLVHRMSWSGGRVEPGLLETGKAVVIAAMTNVAGFGTLTLGSYPALRSFGLVALFGSITCLFTSLTLVPALMARRGPDEPEAGA
jgi:predicted exporter